MMTRNCCQCLSGPTCFGCQLDSPLPSWTLSFTPGLSYNVAQNDSDTDTGGGGQEYYIERRYPDISGVNSMTLSLLDGSGNQSAPSAFFPAVPGSCSWGGVEGYDFHWKRSDRTDIFETADNTCAVETPEQAAAQTHDGTWIHPQKFLTSGPVFQSADADCGMGTCGSYEWTCGWGVAGMFVYLEIANRDWGSGDELSLICRMYFMFPSYIYEDKGGTPYKNYVTGGWAYPSGDIVESNYSGILSMLFPDHPGGLTVTQMAEECLAPHRHSITTQATQYNQEWAKAVDCDELSEAVTLPLNETLVGPHSGTNLWAALGILNIPSSITVTPNYE